MSYNSSIPLNSDYMLISQPQIRANFQAINTVFAQNHEPLNATLQGMHDVLTFRVQPDPVTSSNQIALYTKLVPAVTGDPCLFYAPNSSQTPIQLTYPSLTTKNNTNPVTYPAKQQTFVAGGFVVYLGLVSGATSGQTITVLPSTTLIYVGLSIRRNSTPGPLNQYTACATNLSTNTFKIQFQSALVPQDVFYFAIGK